MNVEAHGVKKGLRFDAEGVSLIDRFDDELSAHRARKTWVSVFGSHFLLEKGRDFDIWVERLDPIGIFALRCSFTSACGRYAFWRLINHQAPDAEQLLRISENNGAKEHKQPRTSRERALRDIARQIDEANENTGILRKLLQFFSE